MEVIIAAFVKSVIVCFGLATGFAYMTLLERKLIARIQVRYGPNRVGPLGLLQPLADGVKLIFKEDITPPGADKVVFTLAPMMSVIAALIAFAVIPIGPDFDDLRPRLHRPAASPICDVGLLYRPGDRRRSASTASCWPAGPVEQQVLHARRPARLGADDLLRARRSACRSSA